MLRILLILCPLVVILACSEQNTNTSVDRKRIIPIDPHSYANTADIHTEHIHLDLEVNFDNKTIYGVARHTMSSHNTNVAIFDIKGLEILKVTLGKDTETATDYSIGESDELLGAPLQVSLTSKARHINIYYKTTEATEALDWLPPSLTEGKKQPFLYTQGQAILTRTWIPLQDTPSNRITYSADVTVPPTLMAVMSADNPVRKNENGIYHFEMNQPIPAYLIALAVGDLQYADLGNNCGVYAEPSMIDAAANEFLDVPKMMHAAESLYGAYQWDKYDIVVLPYSFPFGGMENPRLTFANPTIVAGDRSLVSVIAHELAHSWSGNLVTNATWNDFWLNEGFTVYFENRIMEALYGKEIADILSLIEFQDLEIALQTISKGDHPEDTHLKLELEERNPDDGMTDIAYVKGAYFLRTLEKAVGREKMDAFLADYFATFAFQTITTSDFERYLNEHLLEPNDITFNTKEWIYNDGLPENCITITSNRLDRMKSIADAFNSGNEKKISAFLNNERSDFITQEWQTFIRHLSPKASVAAIKRLDEAFSLSTDANPAVKSDWFQLTIKTNYKEARPHMKAYLCKIGRRWFIESVYQCLVDSDDPTDHTFAHEVFEEAKHNYHFVSKNTISEILSKKRGV